MAAIGALFRTAWIWSFVGAAAAFLAALALTGGHAVGGIAGTGHLERIVFNARTEELRRESMLNELRQRIREVRQGPDGLLYLLTDEDDGALLRIEPAS